MNIPLYHKTKKEFQLERMILFSDAVFAIAITLLIIEIRIPELTQPVTEQKLINSMVSLIPKFIGFVISFFIIGLYWTVHHKMFGLIIGYTNKLIWLNLIFLFGVVLMPFSTSFYSEYVLEYLKLPVIVYTLNSSFLGIMNFFVWKYVSNPRNGLTEHLPPSLSSYYLFRSLAVPAIFGAMLILYLYFSKYAVYIPFFIPLIMFVIAIYYKKKLLQSALKKKK